MAEFEIKKTRGEIQVAEAAIQHAVSPFLEKDAFNGLPMRPNEYQQRRLGWLDAIRWFQARERGNLMSNELPRLTRELARYNRAEEVARIMDDMEEGLETVFIEAERAEGIR